MARCWGMADHFSSMTIAVRFENVSRHFGQVRAVDGVTLDIAEGEFFAMLGPSGSGKTTCLRLIAGFEQPDEGHIEIFGETAEGVPPYRRNVNTVFQDYALFPHMSVGENVAYGLMIRGLGRSEREAKAREALAMVKLGGFEARRPVQLSGGQRQRVALARALVNEPKVLLLDEPLGALDLKLREQMQEELKSLQKEVGITFVFVTHDQGEALAMSDRLAIFNDGRIVQVGRPDDVYERPNSRFVADFVGSSNLLPPDFSHRIGGTKSWASLRPENVTITKNGGQAPAGQASVSGKIASVHYQGSQTRVTVGVDGDLRISANAPSAQGTFREGELVTLSWQPEALHVMEQDS
jgi:putative spermidine/putrescine transport system ATP-binding protein